MTNRNPKSSGGNWGTAIFAFLQIVTLIAITLNGIDLSVGSLHLNSERVLLAIVVPLSLIAMLLGSRLWFSTPAWLYLCWTLTVLVSAVGSGFGRHINGVLVSVAPFIYFLLFMQRGLSQAAIGRMVLILLWVLSISSIIIAVVALNNDSLSFLMDRGRVAFLMEESNVFGAMLAALMMIHLGFFRRGRMHLAAHLLGVIALILTGSKAPYAAYLAGLVFFHFRSGNLKGVGPILLTACGTVVTMIAGFAFSNRLSDFYESMLDRQDAIHNRMFALRIGWHRFLEHPVFGNGPLDFALYNQSILSAMGTDNARNMWIWQIWVAVLHDEGLFGFSFFIAFLIASWVRGERMVRIGKQQFLGYLAAMLVTIIADQTTTTHLSAIFGVLLGLVNSTSDRVMATAKPTRKRAHRPTGAPRLAGARFS